MAARELIKQDYNEYILIIVVYLCGFHGNIPAVSNIFMYLPFVIILSLWCIYYCDTVMGKPIE